jgi:hypothetical protein
MNMSEPIIIERESGLGSFTIGDLGVFIGTLGGVITSILIVLQKSHCKKIKFCCWECDRDVSQLDDIPKLPTVNKPVSQANEERIRIQEQETEEENPNIINEPEPEPEPEPQA